MSKETPTWLNTMVLIGMVAERKTVAWHYDPSLQGPESNHYDGPIPLDDVRRRLFFWEAQVVPMLAEIPCEELDLANGVNRDGDPVTLTPVAGRIIVIRSDTKEVLGVFKDSYTVHDYEDTLIGQTEEILGATTDLVCSSAGLLRNGGRAWLEISMPETVHNPLSGFDFRSNLLAFSSCDGSLASGWAETVNATVCDNTFNANLLEASEAGRVYKVKHSKYSAPRIDAAREALGIVDQLGVSFTELIEEWAKTRVTEGKWGKFLDAYVPVPDKPGRGMTLAEKKRDELSTLWKSDYRVSPWRGTALGVMQAANTWNHHLSASQSDRPFRNQDDVVSGKAGEKDAKAWNTLVSVLGLPKDRLVPGKVKATAMA